MCDDSERIAPLQEKLAFLGAGIIAGVWMERLLSIGAATAREITACDVTAERLDDLRQRFAVNTSLTNRDGANSATVIVIATPPGEVLGVAREIRAALRPGQLVVSLAAGVPLARLEQELAPISVARVMPNTPSLVGEGMNLVAFSRGTSADEHSRLERLLNVFGAWLEVPDEEMGYWCALCSVGPTYIFSVIEALASAAAARGLPADRALAATAQVVAGAARLVQVSGQGVAALKQMISLRTLHEAEAQQLFKEAYDEAVGKLQGLAQRLAA
jgi:pyrroline-5-carboxylate reductase